MDRQIVYAGSIPLDTDLLLVQRHTLRAIGALAQVILGDTGLVDGFACTPASAPYQVTVGPGSYTAPLDTDGTAFGALAADPTRLVQVATAPDTVTLQLGPPPDAAARLDWLVQVKIVGLDSSPVTLPYWNAAAPSVPYSGPGNSGLAQNTQRLLRAVVSVKAGAVADPDCIGLYAIATYPGKPSVAQSDIAALAGAPRLRYKLPAIPPAPTRTVTIGTSGLWQPPEGVQWIRVRAVGGGGGGGGGDTGYSGGGGGAGGYAEALLVVSPGQSVPVTVGGPGAGGAPGQSGSQGGTTSFGDQVSAGGGMGGGSANPVSHGGAPGEGLAGVLLQAGGYGADGVIFPGSTYIPGGGGGSSIFGGGGRGADPGGLPAIGRAAGSGGGGGYGAGSAGGQGAGGLIIIEY